MTPTLNITVKLLKQLLLSHFAQTTLLILCLKGEGIALVLHEGADGATHCAGTRPGVLHLQLKQTLPGPALELSSHEHVGCCRCKDNNNIKDKIGIVYVFVVHGVWCMVYGLHHERQPPDRSLSSRSGTSILPTYRDDENRDII